MAAFDIGSSGMGFRKARRPGTVPRGAGTFGIVFFLIFAAVGVVVLLTAITKHVAGAESLPLNRDFLTTVGIGLLFAVIGFAGAIFSWRSMHPKSVGPAGVSGVVWLENPCFPKVSGQRDVRSGLIRLKPEVSARKKFLGLLLLAVIWNGITGTIVANMARKENMEWFGLAFMSLFVLAGLGLIFAAGHALLRVVLVGDTSVEISREPLGPGQTARIFVKQSGRFEVERAEVRLLCCEEATYRRGTDTVTDKEEVHSDVIAETGRLRVRDGQALIEAQLRIPLDAMHSFEAANNKIKWLVQVKMTIAGKPDVDDSFILRVAPEQVG